METRDDIELTPEQKGVLASLAEETGESASSLIDKVLDELQERLRTARGNGHDAAESAEPTETPHKPIWEKIIEASERIPDGELEGLPTDMAANVDHYAYGLPKRHP